MAIRYDIDARKNVIFMAAYGAISVADIASSIVDIEAHPKLRKNMTLVIELREIKRAFFVREMDRLMALLANEAARFVGRYAFVVSRDTMHGVGRRFAVKAARKGLQLEVFNDYADAAKWLRMVV
ncbi:MAG: hypothetical protein HOG19_02255 [Gammaproteobacteria bacterium]|jgi:hypothetical protein|nr:hypothetical protein [Gammaproteobacteria bacterium]